MQAQTQTQTNTLVGDAALDSTIVEALERNFSHEKLDWRCHGYESEFRLEEGGFSILGARLDPRRQPSGYIELRAVSPTRTRVGAWNGQRECEAVVVAPLQKIAAALAQPRFKGHSFGSVWASLREADSRFSGYIDDQNDHPAPALGLALRFESGGL